MSDDKPTCSNFYDNGICGGEFRQRPDPQGDENDYIWRCGLCGAEASREESDELDDHEHNERSKYGN